MINKGKAVKWWSKGENSSKDIVKVGVLFPNNFVDVFWVEGDTKGRDRIREHGSSYRVEFVY